MSKKEQQLPQGIEQIRDIIFGNTMGDYQKRFTDLSKGIVELEKTFQSKMTELEKTLSELGESWDADVESIHQKMSTEQKALGDRMQKLRSHIMIHVRSIEEQGVPRSDLAKSLIELGQSLKPAVKEKGDITVSILEGEETQ